MEKATRIFARMSEGEKATLRMANAGRIEYLANTAYLADLPLETHDERHVVLTEVYALAMLEFATKSARRDYGIAGVAF